jgi:hypothetical protein
MKASPGFWSLWVDSWRSCEGPTGVREVRGSPAARNRKGGAGYRRRSSGSIPARAGLGVEGGSLGELPGRTAKLLRALAGAGMHRSGWPMTEQKRLRSELRCAAAARVRVAARVGRRGFRVQL